MPRDIAQSTAYGRGTMSFASADRTRACLMLNESELRVTTEVRHLLRTSYLMVLVKVFDIFEVKA